LLPHTCPPVVPVQNKKGVSVSNSYLMKTDITENCQTQDLISDNQLLGSPGLRNHELTDPAGPVGPKHHVPRQ
jgi:hypothetical protein